MLEMNRRTFLAAGAVAATTVLAGCGSTDDTSSDSGVTEATAADADQTSDKKLIVFAAASMTESLDAAGQKFCEGNSGVEISYNFDSSGTLKTQIQEGAECDVFISAGQKQMNQLDAEAESDNDEGLDLIDHSTRVDLLENKVVLAVPDGNPEAISSFDDFAEKLKAGEILVALGNSDVPVGQYSDKILAYYDIDPESDDIKSHITYGSNVKEVTTQVEQATVACGIIYATDAYSAGLDSVAEATEEMCGKVVYPAAVTKNAPEPDLAKTYLDFLQTAPASECFEAVGFTPLSE